MTIDAASLGATLYVPATRPGLAGIASGARFPDLRSVVFCLEDGVALGEVPAALRALHDLAAELRGLRGVGGPSLFVRPRSPAMLEEVTRWPGATHFDGFVLPKATAETLPAWLAALPFAHQVIMPTIETREAFEAHEMQRLRDQLLTLGPRVLALRIGGNDLLRTIGARRSRVRTAYDGPLGPVIASLVAEFAPWGFALSAPVLETFDDPALLAAEVARDLEHGLVTKTAIHPGQVETIHAAYRVPAADLAAAHAILGGGGGVFACDGAMAEPATHDRWAAATVRRAAHFGVVPGEALALAG